MTSRSLEPALRKLAGKHSMAAVLGALAQVCSGEVDRLLGPREQDGAAARPWSRLACKLDELAIYATEEEL